MEGSFSFFLLVFDEYLLNINSIELNVEVNNAVRLFVNVKSVPRRLLY